MKYLSSFSIFILCLLFSLIVVAQPANDNCSNASVILLGPSNMSLGVFNSSNSDLTNATLSTDEFFHQNQVLVGNDKKSVWYKFTIPTARKITVELKQPSNAIALDDAGFTVFKSNSCGTLTNDEAIAGKLIPVPKFGSSFNPCLTPGTYYVQVSAKQSSNGLIFIQVTTQLTEVLDNYDLPTEAYDFGTVENTTKSINVNTGCQSIDNLNAYDVCNPVDSNYTQSLWFIFKTGKRKDHFQFRLLDASFYYTNLTDSIIFKLYKGNVTTTPINFVSLVSSCASVTRPSNPWLYVSNYYYCQLDSNTVYSVQLLYKKDFNKLIQLQCKSFGDYYTLGAKPSALHTSNVLGSLPISNLGTTTTASDYFGCNAKMNQNLCGTTQPDHVIFEQDTFKLATWFVFSLSSNANINIHTDGEGCCSKFLKRLFIGDVRNNCNLPIVASFRNDSMFKCLQSGTYSLQILGKDGLEQVLYDPDQYTHFGRKINLNINAKIFVGKFGLSSVNASDTINNISGIMQALPENTLITSNFDVFTCDNTVLPSGPINICDGITTTLATKAMFRILKVDKNGTLTVFAGSECDETPFSYRLYRGNAKDLANAQAHFAYPQPITGLVDISGCVKLSNYCTWGPEYFNACVTPGEYTLVTFGNIESVGFSDQPKIMFSSFNYNLVNNQDFDTVNKIGGIQLPLEPRVLTNSKNTIFSCNTTVLPSGNLSDCNGSISSDTLKAIYRRIVIDRDGILTINSGINSDQRSLTYRFYKGDASSLATSFTYPDRINGLIDLAGCQLMSKNEFFKVCVTPGVYTLVTFGGSEDPIPYISDAPSFYLDTVTTMFANPTAPNVLPNISSVTGVYNGIFNGSIDYFSCIDNPDDVGGVPPCPSYTKQIYREFYLESENYVRIMLNGHGVMSVFKGRCSNGLNTVQPFVSSQSGPWLCNTYFETQCGELMQPGWYSIVSYGLGETFTSPAYEDNRGGDIGFSNNIAIILFPSPKHNRPHLACAVNNGNPITWGPNSGTVAYPSTAQRYTSCRDNYDCNLDMPFLNHPVTACTNASYNYNRTSYYVFSITQESFLHIDSIPSNTMAKVYPFDVRTADSLLMLTSTPIKECVITNQESKSIPHGGIEFCKLQPGVYSMVIFASDANLINYVQPSFYIDKVENSRFDHAIKAYDFGVIPPNGIEYFGKTGDTNPLVNARKPSHDFISCKTGAQFSDPGSNDSLNNVLIGKCGIGGYPNVYQSSVPYPMSSNFAFWNDLGDTTYPFIRRNLWYTFVIARPGTIKINAYSKTPNSNAQFSGQKFPVSVYESDVDGNLSFTNVVTSNLMDSTITQGLKLIASTRENCMHNALEFTIPSCDVIKKRRYYVIVDNSASLVGNYSDTSNYLPNQQVELGIKFIPSGSIYLSYDFIGSANVINGLNQHNEPYSNVELLPGTYLGDTASFICATRSSSDPEDYNSCAQRTVWYKFVSGISGELLLNYDIPTQNQKFLTNDRNIQIYREVLPNDSVNGLQKVPLLYVYSGDTTWASYCLTSGTYYILLTGCDYLTENVVPRIRLISHQGDICENSVSIFANGYGSFNGSCNIDCHTMGQDFGEEPLPFTNLACMLPETEDVFNYSTNSFKYKTTWFRVDLNAAQKLDLTISLNPSSYPSPIAYRVMLGTCGAMNAYICSTDPFTGTTLRCVPNDGTYFVQVLSPAESVGNIELNISTAASADPSCVPIVTPDVIASFIYTGCKLEDSVQFINRSTAGRDMGYLWDFGDGITSTTMHPYHFYPNVNTIVSYPVTLTATDTVRDITDIKHDTITIFPENPIILPRHAPYCADSVAFFLRIRDYSTTSYVWSDNSTNDTLIIYNSGTYSVTVTNFCRTVIDSVEVIINKIPEQPIMEDVSNVCEGEADTLRAVNYHGVGYNWTGPNNFVSDSLFPILTNVNSGMAGYYVLQLNNNGCLGPADSTLVKVFPIPLTPNVTSNSPVCVFDSIALFATTIPSGIYEWTGPNGFSSNAQNPLLINIGFANAGIYTVKSIANDCKSSPAQTLVSLKPYPNIFIGNDTTICENDLITLDAGDGFTNYLWNNFINSQSILVDTTGFYFVKVTNIDGCRDYDTINVIVNTYPVINLGNDTLICSYQKIILNPGSGYSAYSWSNDEMTPTISTSKDDIYWVEVYNGPCMSTDTIILWPCTTNLWVPNAFTPNGDGLNDLFGVSIENVNIFEINIFNRWGQLVYKSDNYLDFWDGKLQGKPCEQGVYSYSIYYEGSGETEAKSRFFKQGYVILIR